MFYILIITSIITTTTSGLECGQFNKSRSSLTERIVGGTAAELGEFPWQVSVQKIRQNQQTQQSNWFHFCGGSIINEHYILTAAHCVESYKWSYTPGTLRILAGTINWNLNTNANKLDKGMQIISVSRVMVHDGWNRQTGSNDIAILELSTPLVFTSQNGLVVVNKVCMPNQQQQYTGNVWSSGWGFMSKYSRVSPDILRKVEIELVDYQTCHNAFANIIGVTTNQVCAGIANKGNCMGDSGSPLVKIVNNRAYQLGIVSFSIPCAVQGYPDVFTKVASYLDWMHSQIRIAQSKIKIIDESINQTQTEPTQGSDIQTATWANPPATWPNPPASWPNPPATWPDPPATWPPSPVTN